MTRERNLDTVTVTGFGDEWAAFDQRSLPEDEREKLFGQYFSLFPFAELPVDAEGFDLGCGTGRWADLVAPRVGRLHCIDPAEKALAIARQALARHRNVEHHLASSDDIPLTDESQDFGYSLGVLHHVPDTARAMRDCVTKLKPGAPFLVYLYYAFDNRPTWFRTVWKASDVGRNIVSRLPFGMKKAVTSAIALFVYWPLSRAAALIERTGRDVSNFPLSAYRYRSFYSLRTDALDRFGTKLEHRFTQEEIRLMMEQAGLTGVRFRDDEPYWVAIGYKAEANQP